MWSHQPGVPPLCGVLLWKGALTGWFQQLSGLDYSSVPSPAIQGLLRAHPASLLFSRWPVAPSGQPLLVARMVSSSCSHQKQPGLVSASSGTVADMQALLLLGTCPPHSYWRFMGFLLTHFVVDVAYRLFVFLCFFLHLLPGRVQGASNLCWHRYHHSVFIWKNLPVCVSQKYSHSYEFSGA